MCGAVERTALTTIIHSATTSNVTKESKNSKRSMTQMTARHSAALCEPSSSAAWRSVIYTSSRIGAMANTPFTRSSWLDELLCVSWTSQLDVWRLLDVCPMFAWWLFCVYTIEQTSRKYEARYSTKHSVHKAIVKANIEQTSTRHRARIEQTSSWLVQLTYSQLVEPTRRANLIV